MDFALSGIRIEQTQHTKIRDKKMAKLQISVHSDLHQNAQPLVDALQHMADSIEGYYGYIMGCQDKMDANYQAMLWGVTNLSSLVSKERPSYEFGYSDEQDAELEKLLLGIPFPPDTPYD